MTDLGYFDGLYAERDDPWDLATSPYERRKLALLLAALPRPRYASAFEPGCAIGVTTVALADRCDRLIAMDAAASAVEQARRRVETCGRHVTVLLGQVPGAWPESSFDLVVLSELLYYLDGDARRDVVGRIRETLEPGGDVVVVHWRHPFREASTTGDRAHAELAERLGEARFSLLVDHEEADFRLQVHRAAAAEAAQRDSR